MDYTVEIIFFVRYIDYDPETEHEIKFLNNIYQMLLITGFADKIFFLNCQNKMPSINMGFLNMYTISTAIFGTYYIGTYF